MERAFPITALLVLSSLAAAWADEAKPETTVKQVQVTSPDEAKSLAPGTTSVSVRWAQQSKDKFTCIMKALARNRQIRHLSLFVGDTIHTYNAGDEALDVLREFQSLESLEVTDGRDMTPTTLFEQVAAMKNLKQLKFTFL